MSLLSSLYNPPKNEDKKLSMLSRAFIHGGNTADAASTIHALNQQNVRESNPIYGNDSSNAKIILFKAGTSILQDYLLSKLAHKKPGLANALAKVIGGVNAGIATNNLIKSNNGK